MKKGLNYNGNSKKEAFYKLKKYSRVVKRVVNQKTELQKLRSFNNATLNKVLDSFLMAKNELYSSEDKKVFQKVETYRKQLLKDQSTVSYEIFGSSQKKTVASVASISPSSEHWAKFLYCLTKHLQPSYFLEIGTNLGISGSYILHAMKTYKQGNLVTMEGVQKLCEVSNQQFLTITDKDNFEILKGLYEETLPIILEDQFKYDVIFVDGNHQKDPTVHYYRTLKEKCNHPAVFIFDDLYYNTEMTEAWNIIKMDKNISYSIDLQKQGIVIIDPTDLNKNISSQLFLAV